MNIDKFPLFLALQPIFIVNHGLSEGKLDSLTYEEVNKELEEGDIFRLLKDKIGTEQSNYFLGIYSGQIESLPSNFVKWVDIYKEQVKLFSNPDLEKHYCLDSEKASGAQTLIAIFTAVIQQLSDLYGFNREASQENDPKHNFDNFNCFKVGQ